VFSYSKGLLLFSARFQQFISPLDWAPVYTPSLLSWFSAVNLINLYRHPNFKILFSFYSNLFAAASAYKFALILGDFTTMSGAILESIDKAKSSSEPVMLITGLSWMMALLHTCLYRAIPALPSTCPSPLTISGSCHQFLHSRIYTVVTTSRSASLSPKFPPLLIGLLADLTYLTTNFSPYILD